MSGVITITSAELLVEKSVILKPSNKRLQNNLH
jgi:hypothetical protein